MKITLLRLGRYGRDIVVASDFLYFDCDSFSFETCPVDRKLSSQAMNFSFDFESDFDIYSVRFYTAMHMMLDEFFLYSYLKRKNVKSVEMENRPVAKLVAERVYLL